MGDRRCHPPSLLLLAAFSRYESALDWAVRQAARHWGPVALTSETFDFEQTSYYRQTMGDGLKKVLFAFEDLIEPPKLVSAKHESNAWEQQYLAASAWPEPRPLNLDPGYLTEAKLVLATTKDRDHRIYLAEGIFAEVTLYYRRGSGWCGREWTYPDYRDGAYHPFLNQCRQYLRKRIHES
jgi:hypothetical protein